MGCLIGERSFDLCSEPTHLGEARDCTLVSAYAAERLLVELRVELDELTEAVEDSWRAITFKRPRSGRMDVINSEANELVKLDRLRRRLRPIGAEMRASD